MPNLKYKTRTMSNPQGKPKLYFCAHTEDFDQLFESISNEILEIQNCSIWYPENSDVERDESFYEDLKQMQLFVLPVTSALLCTENKALDQDFQFAVNNNIPVLPLMQESGLEQLFNLKCGDIQYLDKNSMDPTAITYEDKLQKYLSDILIGDELAKKVREAFDAYVFMSYRKKDRQYAKTLMHLIHRNEFCRDMAIWYDEFLVPGENFNDSIESAIKKSDLFLLAVTPNLVNEKNYVMTKEYPTAKRENKPILPIEMIPTDRERLKEEFEDIAECVSASDEIVLSDTLMHAIRLAAIREKDKSPEHNFFIGLAYLGGIDVEVDYDRALALIEGAAREGVLPACQKLISMYQYGNGVKKDHFKSIDWRLEELTLLEKMYEKDPSIEIGIQWINAVILLADCAKDQNMYDSAKEAYEAALARCESLLLEQEDIRLKELKVTVLNRLFLLLDGMNHVLEGANHIERVIVEHEAIAPDNDFMLGIYYVNAGRCYQKLEEYKKAEEFILKGIDIYRLNGTNDQDYELVLGRLYNDLGNLYTIMTYYEKAVPAFDKAIDYISDANKEHKNKYFADYTMMVSNKALSLLNQGMFDTAIHDLSFAYEQTKKYMEDNQKFYLNGQLGMIQNLIGLAYFKQKEYKDACNHFKKSIEYYKLIAVFHEYLKQEFVQQGEMTLAEYNLSICYYHLNEYDKAEEYAIKCCDAYKEMISADKSKTIIYLRQYGNAMTSLCSIYFKKKKFGKAVWCFVKMVSSIWWSAVKAVF